jgi:hypothetical protein
MSNDVLIKKAERHLRVTSVSAVGHFERLQLQKQGIIKRLIAERNLREKDASVDGPYMMSSRSSRKSQLKTEVVPGWTQ